MMYGIRDNPKYHVVLTSKTYSEHSLVWFAQIPKVLDNMYLRQ
jgi:hypothetical protein